MPNATDAELDRLMAAAEPASNEEAVRRLVIWLEQQRTFHRDLRTDPIWREALRRHDERQAS